MNPLEMRGAAVVVADAIEAIERHTLFAREVGNGESCPVCWCQYFQVEGGVVHGRHKPDCGGVKMLADLRELLKVLGRTS